MRDRLNLSLPVEMIARIADLADRKRLSRSAIVEAGVASFLSPDGADRMEAAFARRLDRLTRQVQRLERNAGVSAEALALFVRFWLTVTPQLPPEAQAASQVKGRERYEGFIEALGRRLNQDRTLFDEIPQDVPGRPPFLPVACWCARTIVESTITYSKSGSVAKASKSRHQTPSRDHREKRRKTLFHGPKADGRSRHGAEVRTIQSTASMNRRLSFAVPPRSEALPQGCGSIKAHCWSFRTKRIPSIQRS